MRRSRESAPRLGRVVVLSVWLGPVSFASPQSGPTPRVPAGMAAPFIYQSCPEGWRPVASTAGRLVLGTTQATEVGKTVGTPFENAEDRLHQHSYDMSVAIPNEPLAGAHKGGNQRGSKKGSYHSHGTVKEVSARLPFIQFPFCEPDPQQLERRRPYDSWPLSAVSFFTSSECPDGWEPYGRAEGRFVVPTVSRDDRVGKVYGTPIREAVEPHPHDLSASFTTQKVDYQLAKKFIWWNKNVARHGTYQLEGETTEEYVDIPFVKLSICRIRDDARTEAAIPSGLMVFVGAQRCDIESGWDDAPGTKGRYLVGLPQGGETGLTFGGPPLEDGELRAHSHDFDGSVTLSTYSIAGAAGCCAEWYAGKGEYPFSGVTQESVVELPYVALRQCLRR